MADVLTYFQAQLSLVQLVDIIDITVVACLIFQAIKLLRETRAIQLVKGVAALIAIYLVAYFSQLKTVTFLMRSLLQIGTLALLILFQPELRRALEQMGRTRITALGTMLFNSQSESSATELRQQWEKAISATCDACASMSRQKTGALIIFERQTPLGDVISTGTLVDAQPSYELICNIFFHNSPLHDGAMVMRGGKVYAAGCFLPLSANFTISRELGTRHRAALGMSENSDALVVVVSEETGKITVAENGKLLRGLTVDELRTALKNGVLMPMEPVEPRRRSLRKFIRDAAPQKAVSTPDEEVSEGHEKTEL